MHTVCVFALVLSQQLLKFKNFQPMEKHELILVQ